jgi:hemerythrin-like domain-containing protein
MTGNTRRDLLASGIVGALGTALTACTQDSGAKEVGAVEDLMREHGVLRRVLLVYAESVPKLRGGMAVNAAALHRAAELFRDFGEEYHEKKLEEAHIFPRVKKAGGTAAGYVDVLLVQHRRGREITRYILGATTSPRAASGAGEPLARAFESFVRMYQNHTAREDTIVFQAWKNALSARELDEMGEKFEDIETAQFGGDGFEKAVKEIGEIELALGFADLAQFTAPTPPRESYR